MSEGAIEADGVLADEQHEDRVDPVVCDAPDDVGELRAAERHEDLITDPAVAQRRVPLRGRGRPPRPDVVVADDAPAAHAGFGAKPLHRGQELARRRLAHHEHARVALPALVQRRVHVRHEPGDPRRQGVADR